MTTKILHPNEMIMRELIQEAWRDEKGIVAAVIDPEGNIIAKDEATIWADHDPTAHAEINPIRAACKKLKTDNLSGYWLYSTFEPCPLCSSAIIWADFEGVVYANLQKSFCFAVSSVFSSTASARSLSTSAVALGVVFVLSRCPAFLSCPVSFFQ